MREPERSADEALRQSTYRRLYLGALEIEDPEDQLQAIIIILLGGRMGLRTGEIQHIREEWINWNRGELAIPRYDPCACSNCWANAKDKSKDGYKNIKNELLEYIESVLDEEGLSDEEFENEIERTVRTQRPSERYDKLTNIVIEGDEDAENREDAEEILSVLYIVEDEGETEEDNEDDEDSDDKASPETRSAEEILYQERWQPKYERSARRIPFGHSPRLKAALNYFFDKKDCLEISQPTMMQRVRTAAEHAKGVDPEYITIRGLRATAATHISTFLRFPKSLQDYMGWTRIETAARYLRRSGAYTTDETYNRFPLRNVEGDIYQGPPIYPEEKPEDISEEILQIFPRAQAYPILANPLPYEKEPFDPMQYLFNEESRYTSDNNKLGGKKRKKNSKILRYPHPRSRNAPESLNYDPERHKISEHDDGSFAFVEPEKKETAFSDMTFFDIDRHHDEIPDEETRREYNSLDSYYSSNPEVKKLHNGIFYDDGQKVTSEKSNLSLNFINPIYNYLNTDMGLIGRKVSNTVNYIVPERLKEFSYTWKGRVVFGSIGAIILSAIFVYIASFIGIINWKEGTINNILYTRILVFILIYLAIRPYIHEMTR